MPLDLTSGEKEVVLLKAVWDMINEAVNHSVLRLHHNDPDSQVWFCSDCHQKYFNIILVDLLSKPGSILGIENNYLTELQTTCETPHFEPSEIGALRGAVHSFQHWLREFVDYGAASDARNLWFPSINLEVQLQIQRLEFIRICGNISKHNFSRLGRQGNDIIRIFERSGRTLSMSEALLIIDEFYQQFHDDILAYHGSTLAEFLNNIRIGIYQYLRPEFQSSIVYDEEEVSWGARMYKYTFPRFVQHAFAKEIYWNLMNMVRGGPWMPQFEVTSYLKGRY